MTSRPTLRDQTVNLIADTIPELDRDPWVLQVYVNDEFNLGQTGQEIRGYAKGCRSGRCVSGITYCGAGRPPSCPSGSREGGLFKETAADCPWRGRRRRVRLVLYRRLSEQTDVTDISPDQALNELCAKVDLALRNAGIHARRYEGADFYEWLMMWFNPRPASC